MLEDDLGLGLSLTICCTQYERCDYYLPWPRMARSALVQRRCLTTLLMRSGTDTAREPPIGDRRLATTT